MTNFEKPTVEFVKKILKDFGFSQHMADTLNIDIDDVKNAIDDWQASKTQVVVKNTITLTLEHSGKMIALKGQDTKSIKEILKELGGRWSSDEKAWKYPQSKKDEI